ncbi:hypothetical protein ABT390_34345 [Streptomyces aurantiacus]|uniref:hypothetical protein n=1 Tax=Streptomyces aurantiacus TaxID=47760 RepID=UPI001319C71E|nr:hypothetical protein [Streptomyces aurantiacus]
MTRRPVLGSRALWAAVLGLVLGGASLTATATATVGTDADARTPRTERVSTTADGAQLDGASTDGALSGDGRHAAFVTRAPALGCGQYAHCLKVKDLRTGALTGIDLGSGHLYGAPLLSTDGSRVAFTANKRFAAPYLHDRATGTSTRLWPADPPGSNELGAVQAISPDGTRVAYTIGNRNGNQNFRLLYVRDTTTGTDELISAPEEGQKGGASVADDGTRVAYQIGGHSEGPEDRADVFLKEPGTGARTQIDTGLGTGELIRLTNDGRRVLFNARGGLYLHTVRTGSTERVADGRAVSATPDGRHAVLTGADGLRVLDLRTGRGTGIGPADARAARGAVSDNGRAVAFSSASGGLVPDDTNGVGDVFVRHTAAGSGAAADARAPRTERVSLAGDGSQFDGPSREAAISGDGRYVAFATKAPELGCHVNVYTCLVLKDRVTGALTEIPNDGDSSWGTPMLSHDGRYVGHTAGTKAPKPWLYDRETGETVKVAGPETSGVGLLLAVTPDGGRAAYTTGDRFHAAQQLYVRDLRTGANELIDGTTTGADRIGAASLSADGRFLAYRKRSADGGDIVVRDRTTGETAQADAGLGAADGEFVKVSENGRRVLFAADGGTYAYDVRAGAPRKVADTPAKSASGDGRHVVLADGEALTLLDVRTGRRTPVGPGRVEPGAVSAHGRHVAFASDATDLAPDDTNGRTDVFVRRTLPTDTGENKQ